MKLTRWTAAILAALSFQAALAESQPKHSVHDGRIQMATYRSDDVFPVLTKVGEATLIELEADERLSGDNALIGMGDTAAWKLAAKGRNIIFKPIAPQPDTNAAKISLAVSETWTDKNTGQKQERTEWFTVLFRNKLAATCTRATRFWCGGKSSRASLPTKRVPRGRSGKSMPMKCRLSAPKMPHLLPPYPMPIRLTMTGKVRNTSACNPYPSKTAKAACTFYERAGCFFSHFIET